MNLKRTHGRLYKYLFCVKNKINVPGVESVPVQQVDSTIINIPEIRNQSLWVKVCHAFKFTPRAMLLKSGEEIFAVGGGKRP
ncbi:hypothetical protein AYI68_g2694 [Smittium mucronatum]|uniref:Uncharacterized protein n=1 Tax=Smittium mucronatum TaxID=133383 RepID=A0A1R0H232_9FUNG|nr:hypothetical protein AYI68_g2694 [Smittium mucronatum]